VRTPSQQQLSTPDHSPGQSMGSQKVLSEFKTQITSSIFSDHNRMKAEINNKREAEKITEIKQHVS
jgi:hypothetical protein